MKGKTRSGGNGLARTVILAVGLVLVLLAAGWHGVRAGEQEGMPSERASRGRPLLTEGAWIEQAALVRSLYRHEDRILLNGEPYVLKQRPRIEDEQGRAIPLEEVPVGSRVLVRYRRASGLEDSGCVPGSRILGTIRILQREAARKGDP